MFVSIGIVFGAPKVLRKKSATLIFQRFTESNVRAFSLLVPIGWHAEGGIFRVNPLTQGGPAQSIAAKVDFKVKKDRAGSVMIRWLPVMLYFDARNTTAGQMGLFPPGSNYQGMTVYPIMPAQQFLSQVVFPYVQLQASQVAGVEQRALSRLAQKYQQRVRAALPFLTFSYDAALLVLTYVEEGGSV